MMPLWARELADAFWAEAGFLEMFPRQMMPALRSGAFTVTVTEMANLSLRKVENRLAHRGMYRTTGEPERPLRACVAAFGETAWIFLDANDDADEKHGSLTHEVAHYLRHCRQPRRRAIAALGPRIVEVLDGKREPTPQERFAAVMRDVPLGIHVHYLRREAGHVPPAEREVEEEADLLAWQLLAPSEVVLSRVTGADRDAITAVLITDFGLSSSMARDYAAWLCPEVKDSPIVRKLAAVWKSCRGDESARE